MQGHRIAFYVFVEVPALEFVSLTRTCSAKNMQRGDSRAHRSPCSSAAVQQNYDLLSGDGVAEGIQNQKEGGCIFFFFLFSR